MNWRDASAQMTASQRATAAVAEYHARIGEAGLLLPAIMNSLACACTDADRLFHVGIIHRLQRERDALQQQLEIVTANRDELAARRAEFLAERAELEAERDALTDQLVEMRATLSSVADWMQRFTVGLARITQDEEATMRRIGEAEALPISPAQAAAAERLKERGQ